MTLSESVSSDVKAGRSSTRRAVLSSYLGSVIEYYDFVLYATASAVVFGPVFFASLSPLAATVASYATLAVGFLARPLGGLVFGRYGDLLGRKRMLIISMMMMGVATALIGLVPAVPTWGAAMLVLLRIVQGVAIGGEWGGAALLSAEHSSTARRGFAASFTLAGAPTGAVLGTLALALAGLLPKSDFLSWGWRVPFLFSAVLLLVGFVVQRRAAESPLFRAPSAETRHRLLREVLRRPRALVVVVLVCIAGFAIQAMFTTYGVTYAVTQGLSKSAALLAFAIAQVLAIPGTLGAGWASDRYGRRPIMLAGLMAMLTLIYPVFAMLGSGRFVPVLVALVLALAVGQSVTFGPVTAFVSEQFKTSVRYTGASLGFQAASVLGAGLTPLIVTSLVAHEHGSVTGAEVYLACLCVISGLVIAFFAKESKGTSLSDEKDADLSDEKDANDMGADGAQAHS